MSVIMVVEDDEKISKLLCLKLSAKGFTALPYYNGADAWAALQKTKPNLILMDVQMPRMNGFELLTLMKKNQGLKSVPVIFLTSVAQEEDVVKGLEMGANDYVIKPFSFAELHARMKKWL
jgi:two-component system OmpR family response regulator